MKLLKFSGYIELVTRINQFDDIVRMSCTSSRNMYDVIDQWLIKKYKPFQIIIFTSRIAEWNIKYAFITAIHDPVFLNDITADQPAYLIALHTMKSIPSVRLQNLPWSKTGLVSRQVLHPLSKLQNWIWSKTGRYKTGLVSNTKIEASLRATKPKPWQSNLTSDTVEIFIQNEKAGLVPMQSRFRSRHKAGFGAAGLGTAQSWFWSRHKASFGAVSRPV